MSAGMGYMPPDWKPRMSFAHCTTGRTLTEPGQRSIRVQVGGRHLSLPDGTRIEPLQVSLPIDDLRELRAALDRAEAWLADAPAARECEDMGEVD